VFDFAGSDGEAGPPQAECKPGEEGDPDRLVRTYVLIIDSLGGTRTSTMMHLKRYLALEARDKLGLDVDQQSIKGLHVRDAPRQDNLTDCGCFLLQYVEEVFRHFGTLRAALVTGGHAWFSVEHAKGRRARMAAVMEAMGEAYRVRHPDMHQVIDLGNSSDVEEISID
jgi:hypothetical protein